MRRRFKEKKEEPEDTKREVKEEPKKEETFAERRRRRLAEREKQKEKEKEKEQIKEEELQTPKEEKPIEEKPKPEPIRYTRRFKRDIQKQEQKEEKQEENNNDKELKNDDNNNLNNNIINENDKKISEMKKQYDKIEINDDNIKEEENQNNNNINNKKEEKEEEENIKVDLSGQAFNNKLEELSKLAKTTQLDYFFEGTYCDIKDQYTNQWKTGVVLERTDTEVKIKYYYSNINKTIFTFNVSDAIDKDIAMFRKFTQEENYYYNNAYQKMKSEAVTNPRLFEAKAALKVLCSMKNFSNKEFDEAFESPLEIIFF